LALATVGPGLWIRDGLAAQERRERAAALGTGVLVEGEVVDHDTGDPLRQATVSLGAGPSGIRGRGTRVTDDEGHFSFRDVPAGTYRLYVSRPGYLEMRDTLQVSAERDLDLILPLSTDPIPLEPIIVTVRPSSPAMRGYEARRRSGRGFVVTREEIRERQPRLLTELLHRVPGGMVVPAPPHGYTLVLRGQCRPGIWMDGVPLGSAVSIDQLLAPQDVEAVEVFHGAQLPVEFGVNPCGGVLIWTRRGAPPSSGAESETGLGILGPVLVTVALLVTALLAWR
jgi:hypothetical protein